MTTSAPAKKIIVIWGTPADGFEFWGPFKSESAAEEWAERTFVYPGEWSYAELKNKDEPPIYVE